MRWKHLLTLPFLLAACNSGAIAVPVTMLSTPTPPATSTYTSSLVLPTSTFTPSLTDTVTSTETPSSIPTETFTDTLTGTPTDTPTETPGLFTYVFPVQPARLGEFTEGGHPYPATDIFVPIGTKFVAVTNGVVDLVVYVDKWDPAKNDPTTVGGLCIRILGDDGVHYYGAHLSAIAKGIRLGVWVQTGQLLGLTGNTGDARFTTPHLHFEISNPVPPFVKVDPFPILTAWRAGHDLTPSLATVTSSPTP